MYLEKNISDFISPGFIRSQYLSTPEYVLYDYLPIIQLIPTKSVKEMIDRIKLSEEEVIPNSHILMKELKELSHENLQVSDNDYYSKIIEWSKKIIDTPETQNLRTKQRNQKANEARLLERTNFEKSLIPGNKISLCDIGGYPEKVVYVIEKKDQNNIVLSDNYSLKKDDTNHWIVFCFNEQVYCEPRIYIEGLEDFIKIRNGVYFDEKPLKKHKPKLLLSDDVYDFISFSYDDIFDINNYVKTYMKDINGGSIMTYMNRVFGPCNFSGDIYKDMSGSWIVSTSDKNLVLRVKPCYTSSNYSFFWFRFYLKQNAYKQVRKGKLKDAAYYTSIMKQTLDYFLKSVNERDVFFNIVGLTNNDKNAIQPHWASTLSLSFLTEDQKVFYDFCDLLDKTNGQNNKEKFKNLLSKLEEH